MRYVLRLVPLTMIISTALFVGSTYYYHSPFYKSITKALAIIHPTQDNRTSGIVSFVHKPEGLYITAHITGLRPGKHGFHIHEFGDCTAANASSAGDHYNPTGQPHAGPKQKYRHVGDLGNIVADENGNATYSALNSQTTLNGPNSIIGRAIIVHADPDDLVSQPTGAAGARLGCGVIGVGK